MDQKSSEGTKAASPPKQMKSRSKSIEETQQMRRGISSQKSLPCRPELEKVKECPLDSDTPSSSIEQLK